MMKKAILFLFLCGTLAACKKEKEEETPVSNPQPAQTIPSEFAEFAGVFDGEGVGSAVNLKDDIILLFNQDGDRYAWFEDQEIKVIRDLDDNDSPFATCPLETVGAACLVSEDRMYIFNEEGELYIYGDFNYNEIEGEYDDENFFTWASSEPSEAWQWGPDNTNPFTRISAMWIQSEMNGDCFDATPSFPGMIMADGNGDELVYYSLENYSFSDNPYEIDQFTAENNCGGLDGLMPFESIGAACRHVEPNQIREIFFNEEGTQFCYFTVSEGIFSEIYELY